MGQSYILEYEGPKSPFWLNKWLSRDQDPPQLDNSFLIQNNPSQYLYELPKIVCYRTLLSLTDRPLFDAQEIINHPSLEILKSWLFVIKRAVNLDFKVMRSFISRHNKFTWLSVIKMIRYWQESSLTRTKWSRRKNPWSRPTTLDIRPPSDHP